MATMSPGSKLVISSSNESHYHKLMFTFAYFASSIEITYIFILFFSSCFQYDYKNNTEIF